MATKSTGEEPKLIKYSGPGIPLKAFSSGSTEKLYTQLELTRARKEAVAEFADKVKNESEERRTMNKLEQDFNTL